MNDYRNGPLIETSAGHKVWSYTAFVDECVKKSGDSSTKVRDLAEHEWNHGRKNVSAVVRRARDQQPHQTQRG